VELIQLPALRVAAPQHGPGGECRMTLSGHVAFPFRRAAPLSRRGRAR
jgi:hypothetical protein